MRVDVLGKDRGTYPPTEAREVRETTGGDIVAICTVVGCCIAGYALVREMVKDKGRRDGRGY